MANSVGEARLQTALVALKGQSFENVVVELLHLAEVERGIVQRSRSLPLSLSLSLSLCSSAKIESASCEWTEKEKIPA